VTDRFEDTPDLFGHGAGVGTTRKIVCGICGEVYSVGGELGDTVSYTDFAGMEVAFCCFERIERDIWARRHAILPWIERILARGQKDIDRSRKDLGRIKEAQKE